MCGQVWSRTSRPASPFIVPDGPLRSGLAYQGSGTGGILLIEASTLPGGKGRLVLTGSLGDVIKESAELGLSWVRCPFHRAAVLMEMLR